MRRALYRRYALRRPRFVGAEELTRILSRGGMVVDLRGELCVFRTRDARRMRVGITRPETLAFLEAEGAIRRGEALPLRYVAGISR